MAKRILVVAPKGLVRQWQAEMRLHFGESFQFIEPAELSAFRQWRSDEENLWRLHDQVICSLDSVKPLEGRRGWSLEQLSTYNRERFEDLISASWDLVIIDEAHRMGGSTDQVARYKLGAALAEAAPYLLLLSATPHQGKTDQFHRLMQLLDRDSFPVEGSMSSERVGPFVVRTEKRVAIDAEGKPLFKPRMTRLHPVAWQDRHASQQKLYEGPVMVHHVPRYLALRRNAGEKRIALLVFDGLALDQWFQIREHLASRLPGFSAEEGGCFAWLPTLTSVSRQALFSGLKPREFSNSIESTSQEPSLWARFWQENGLRRQEIVYQKGLKRAEQLAELEDAVSRPATRIAGIVVDMVDEIVHGAMLGKRGIAGQINAWCETGFVEKLFLLLAEQGYQIYLTADHGNVDAEGIGRLSQGVVSELRGERVRTYRSETLAASVPSEIDVFRFDSSGLPPDFLPVYAGTRGAFVPKGDKIVAHGGISIEELIVPFVKINIKRPAS